MKKLTLLILLFTAIGYCQEKFQFSINSEPNATIKDGFNIGADITYIHGKMYHSIGVFLFPNLNNVGYTQLHFVPIGLSLPLNRWNEFRGYIGLMGGVNYREGNPNPIAGIDGGIDWYITDGFGIGLQSSYIHRSDSEFYGGKEWMFNGAIKLIWHW